MGANCCTIGENEKETLKRTLSWASSWASSIARDLNIVKESIGTICHYGGGYSSLHSNYDGVGRDEILTKLESIKTLLSGLYSNINNTYIDFEDKENVLHRLIEQFDRTKKQCEDELPIPTSNYMGYDSVVREHLGLDKAYSNGNGDEKIVPIVASIDGSGRYWRKKILKDYYGAVKTISESIENAGRSKYGHGDSKENENRPIILVFSEREVVNTMFEKVGNNVPMIDYLSEKYVKNGIRFLYRKETIAEFYVEDEKKERKDIPIKICELDSAQEREMDNRI